MSEIIIGSPASGAKVLRRQNIQKDLNGLETITENYTIRTADRATITPAKDTLHSTFSTAIPKYSRMVVETTTLDETDGGLTTLTVVYVGLTSSTGLPPAIVRLLPTPGAGIFGPAILIEAEYLTDKTETQFMQDGSGGQIVEVGIIPPYGSGIAMPSDINGTAMPRNPREPFKSQTVGTAFNYHGYLQQTISSEKRGLFLVVRVIFAEAKSGIAATSFSAFA